jgi:hypothetical protein
LKCLFLKGLQFVNLTPNHGKALRNIKRHVWSVPSWSELPSFYSERSWQPV